MFRGSGLSVVVHRPSGSTPSMPVHPLDAFAAAHRRLLSHYPSSRDTIASAAECARATIAGARRRRSGTAHIASAAILLDILLDPTLRSRNTIGTSVTLKPANSA